MAMSATMSSACVCPSSPSPPQLDHLAIRWRFLRNSGLHGCADPCESGGETGLSRPASRTAPIPYPATHLGAGFCRWVTSLGSVTGPCRRWTLPLDPTAVLYPWPLHQRLG